MCQSLSCLTGFQVCSLSLWSSAWSVYSLCLPTLQVYLCSSSCRGWGKPQISSPKQLLSRSRKINWRIWPLTWYPAREMSSKIAWYLSLINGLINWTTAVHCFKSHGAILGSARPCSYYIFPWNPVCGRYSLLSTWLNLQLMKNLILEDTPSGDFCLVNRKYSVSLKLEDWTLMHIFLSLKDTGL